MENGLLAAEERLPSLLEGELGRSVGGPQQAGNENGGEHRAGEGTGKPAQRR
jgi:hypothetical protein